MKIKVYLLFIALSFGVNFLSAQHENDNWLFGNNKWKFDNSSPNGFTHTTNLSPYIRYGSSVISDKNTGQLLFSSDGYKIYNKNSAVMTGGNHLFGTPNNGTFSSTGNPSDQSSIIVPAPNSTTRYYVFYINGDRRTYDQDLYPYVAYNYGLRYAIVDMSLGGGLGEVTSSNNELFSNSTTNALTSTFGSDGKSYWIIASNNGNLLSYKLDANGLNTTPILNPTLNYGNFFKISPNSKKLLTRTSEGIYLSDFNNTTGSITNQINIIPNNLISEYRDIAGMPNSAEFSPDNNIVYFTISASFLCCGIVKSGLAMYNISTGVLKGYTNLSSVQYEYPLSFMGATGAMQRAINGKIYLIINKKNKGNPLDSPFYGPVEFGGTLNNNYYTYDWQVINTPNVWNPSLNPLTSILANPNTRNGFSFPQLIPSLENVNTCPNTLDINYLITVSENFQAGQSITASSVINNDLIVNYKAGQNVTLNPEFYVKATRGSLFRAYIGPCDGIESFAISSKASESYSKETEVSVFSEVKIYPNPASDHININSGNEKITSWQLFDISGKSVLTGISNQVNVQGLPKAIYLLKININNKITTKKVIVK